MNQVSPSAIFEGGDFARNGCEAYRNAAVLLDSSLRGHHLRMLAVKMSLTLLWFWDQQHGLPGPATERVQPRVPDFSLSGFLFFKGFVLVFLDQNHHSVAVTGLPP